MWSDSIILRTVVAEFSDLDDVERITRVTVRLILAATLAGALGYEREHQGKAAGLRTHMLVGIGAALFVLAPLEAGVSANDLTRVLQGVVAGIGFLGAGSIIKGQQEENVKGLTTASTVWLTAAIGITAGIGLAATAVLTTLLALVILSVFRRLAKVAYDRSEQS
jgi:putative Mg2+ transporter-C (MgtC) family protein